jgi:hypothetical protein
VLTERKSTTSPQKKRPLARSVVMVSTSHQAGSEVLHVRTPSPPPAQAKNQIAYMSPDRLRLREALMCGGEMTEFEVDRECKMFMIASRRVLSLLCL